MVVTLTLIYNTYKLAAVISFKTRGIFSATEIRSLITCIFSVIRLTLFVLVVIGKRDYFGFSFTTVNCQSLYYIIRIPLEAHETRIISV